MKANYDNWMPKKIINTILIVFLVFFFSSVALGLMYFFSPINKVLFIAFGVLLFLHCF